MALQANLTFRVPHYLDGAQKEYAAPFCPVHMLQFLRNALLISKAVARHFSQLHGFFSELHTLNVFGKPLMYYSFP